MDKKALRMIPKQTLKTILITALLLSLASCNLPNTGTKVTPPVPFPTNTAVSTLQAITPTQHSLPPTYTVTVENTPKANPKLIQVENVSNLTNTQNLQENEPVRMKWSLDQNSFILIGYQSFWVYSFPQLKLLYKADFQPEEMLIDFSPNGEEYAVTFNQSSILIKNWKDNSIRKIQTDINFIYGEYSPDGSQIILDQAEVWAGDIYDVASGKKVVTLTGFETAAPVFSVSFGADGAHAIWQARATIQVSDIASNTLGSAIYHEDFLTSYALSPNGKILATSTDQMKGDQLIPQVFFYQPMSGEPLGSVELSIPAYSMDFSPDSTLLAAVDGTHLVIIDSRQMNEVARFSQDVDSINQVLFSPDGTMITTIGSDQLVRFWQVNP